MNPVRVLELSIAGMPLRVELECAPALQDELVWRYAAFDAPGQVGAPTVRVVVQPGPEYIPRPDRGPLQLQTARRNGRIEFMSHDEKGWFDRGLGEGHLAMRPN